ncbi:hypothetical protein DW801_06520 [Coprobacillus sp. AM32-11LB]|uniref:type IV secretory system conjugative DNA transfer family protein n=1 Tax=Faecalibacillus intestinalis TaxID=1982626 RepID=UPI000E4FC97F|nr:type IV secretory system conjugative DNA transfer family protein [Faecalibacillus intestinalis]RHT34678.1 hypothetical protein DW801_06520 [Coprobacillus sp. AM32-11LB]
MIKINDRIKYAFLTGLFFSIFTAMQISYNLSNTGITFNPLFAFNNLYLLLGCIAFGMIPAIMLILNNLENLGKDNRNYSKLVNVNYFKENFNKITFNQNAEIVENRQLFLTNDIRTQINMWTKEHKLEFLKIPLSKQNLGFGIFFVTGKNYVYVDNTDHHTLIIGTTGSGKSFSFILPMLCLLAMTGESGLCVDIKGELSQATAELFKSKGYRVYFLDFIEPQNSDCWNPLYLGSHEYMKQLKTKNEQENYLKNKLEKGKEEFEILHGNVAVFDGKEFMGRNEAGDYIYNEENNSFLTDADFSQAQEYLRDVVQAITEGKKQGQDQEFWNQEAGRILEGYVHLLCETGNINVVNIPAVNKLMLDGDEVKRKTTRSEITFLQYYLKNYKTNFDISKERLSSYVDSAEQTRKSSRNVLTKHLTSIVTNDAIKKILSNNTIDLENIDSCKTMIFLKVHDEKQTYYPLVTLFIKQLWQCLVKETRKNSNLRLKHPFNILFDEMGQFPKFQEITNILTAGRSRGVRMNMVVQGFDQLESAYGKNEAQTIRSNATNLVYLLSKDYQTLEEISKTLGTKKTSKTKEERVVTVDRLKNFKLGEVLIMGDRGKSLITNVLPFNKYNYYKNLKKYSVRNIPKKEPKYFDIKKEIEMRENMNEQ